MMKKPLLNTAVQIAGKAISVIISLLTTGILTRKLGVDSYGHYILITSLFVFLDSLADFGTKTIGVREISANKSSKVVGQIFNLRLLMATTAYILGVILIWTIPGLVGFRYEAMVALLMVFLTSVAGFIEIVFQSKLRMELKVIMDTIFPFSFLIWLVLWKGEVNLLMVFSVYIIARIISIIVGKFLAGSLGTIKVGKMDREEMWRLWKMTWPMGVFLMMFATYDRAVDAFLIQHFLGAQEVAWYGLAYKIYGVMLQPAYFYVNSIFPMMSRKNTNSASLIKISTFIMLLAALAAVVVVQGAAPFMVEVLAGANFEPAVGILRLLILAAIFSYMGHLVGFDLIARGGQKEMLKIGGVALIFNFGLNVILIPRYGVTAAALVTVMTELLDMGLMAYFLGKYKASSIN